ncbi:MAG: hypothetical protein ACRC3I_01940 [Cetobacterium sp.]
MAKKNQFKSYVRAIKHRAIKSINTRLFPLRLGERTKEKNKNAKNKK